MSLEPGEELHEYVRAIDLAAPEEELQQRWNALLNALLEGARVLAVTAGDPPGILAFQHEGYNDGQPFLPVFSSLVELRGMFPDVAEDQIHPVVLTDLANAVQIKNDLAGVTIDPFTKGLILTREELAQMVSYAVALQGPQQLPNDATVLVGEPDAFPVSMMDTLISAARRLPTVRQLWLRQMAINNAMSYLILVNAAPGAANEAIRGLGSVIDTQPALPLRIQLMAYDASNADWVDDVDPFYDAEDY